MDEFVALMRAGLAVSRSYDADHLLYVPTPPGPAPTTNAGWRLYRQTNGGDGVTARGSLLEEMHFVLQVSRMWQGTGSGA